MWVSWFLIVSLLVVYSQTDNQDKGFNNKVKLGSMQQKNHILLDQIRMSPFLNKSSLQGPSHRRKENEDPQFWYFKDSILRPHSKLVRLKFSVWKTTTQSFRICLCHSRKEKQTHPNNKIQLPRTKRHSLAFSSVSYPTIVPSVTSEKGTNGGKQKQMFMTGGSG